MATHPSALLALACIALAGCSPDGAPRKGPAVNPADPIKAAEAIRPGEREPIRIVGTVRHLAVEGGVYVIRTADGTQYRPVDLPSNFRVEGLEVEVRALRHDDVLTKDMAGQTIEILEIGRRAAE